MQNYSYCLFSVDVVAVLSIQCFSLSTGVSLEFISYKKLDSILDNVIDVLVSLADFVAGVYVMYECWWLEFT